MADDHRIADEAVLRRIIGEPRSFVRAKVLDRLNEAMTAFVRQSPLLFLSTIDADGLPDVSPKGDPAGFVEVDAAGDLLIPERPGNRLVFGFENILRSAEVGLILVVPHQQETLRVKGFATLHDDPAVLARMAVGGRPALLYTRVAVRECFFHCGKAMIRSHLWQPEQWPARDRSIAARQFVAGPMLDDAAVERTETMLAQAYRDELY